MKDLSLSELMKLFMTVENGPSHDFSIELTPSDSELSYCCFMDNDRNELGCINFFMNGITDAESCPSISISTINNSDDLPHLGTYLLACFMLGNASNLRMNSEISFCGFDNRRRGDIGDILKEYSLSNNETIGGRKSQMLHLNMGFKPLVSSEELGEVLERLFNTLESFDVSADFISKRNEDDSYFSKLVCTKLCGWSLGNSERVYNILSTAYNHLNNAFSYLSDYVKYSSMAPLNHANKLAIEVYSSRAKKAFLNSYDSLYNEALREFRVLRHDLKNELVSDYKVFNRLIKAKLTELIKPFDNKTLEEYMINISKSRGMKEFKYMVDEFNPELAGIALPKPELVKNNFDLIADYISKNKH